MVDKLEVDEQNLCPLPSLTWMDCPFVSRGGGLACSNSTERWSRRRSKKHRHPLGAAFPPPGHGAIGQDTLDDLDHLGRQFVLPGAGDFP